MTEMDSRGAALYMRFDKPFRSAQGMAIHGRHAFQLFHTGKCAVFDLESRSPAPLCVFPLGSENEGHPTDDYINHSNQCMFGTVRRGDNPLPLLYVTTGFGIGADEDGYFYRCAVEDIRVSCDENGVWSGRAETVQTISYRDGGIEETAFRQPCWGCPAWFPDVRENALYMFSARYRTTEAFKQYYSVNQYIVTRFDLPDPLAGGFIHLGPRDIRDQFAAPFDIPFTQGGMIAGGKIFYTFGLGDQRYPDGLRVYDLKRKCLAARADLSRTVLGNEEIESCSFYGGRLFCNTNAKPQGGIYDLGEAYAQLLED